MWWIYALLSALFAALTAVFAKIGVKGVDSDLATAIRTSLILVMVWSIALVKGNISTLSHFSRHTWLFLLLSGVATGLSWLFYFKAIQLGPLSKVAPIDKLSIAFTIIFSVIFLKESVDIKTVIGAAFVICGVVILAW